MIGIIVQTIKFPGLTGEQIRAKRESAAAIEDFTMTTTVKVHVNGKYRATVVQDGRIPVIVEGNYNGGSGEVSFYLHHSATGVFHITEEQVADGDERPAT